MVGDQGGDCDQEESWGSGLCSYQDFNYFRSLFAPEMKTSTISILFTLAGVAVNHNTLFLILILMISIKLTKLTIIRWSTSSPSPWPSRIVAGSFSRTGDSDLFIALDPSSIIPLSLDWLGIVLSGCIVSFFFIDILISFLQADSLAKELNSWICCAFGNVFSYCKMRKLHSWEKSPAKITKTLTKLFSSPALQNCIKC